MPNVTLEYEYVIEENLRLDIYCPEYHFAAEYHGRQHFEFVEHFHKERQVFLDSQKRDARKIELCDETGIALVIFDYREKLTKELVFDRMMHAIQNSKYVPKKKPYSVTMSPWYQRAKEASREYNKLAYRRYKERNVRP